eukprot:CAMPEP_0117025076 /NCGR_PEP_ID=MMETSP0472-20121206/18565_1 /TAXON_ID=693140 ORGANISM="Tiarina fusus, Strain LIS" /NCGR_SAMPLE_ID=MMETSP0472 /ASSEMBLY_ACC=CAM_ASM_000603 /LENGTH=144 /DNA_ID=CAMNT_0004731701 /DNA_START=67 /DNA_END=498 /DNA_ORIENTATION=-
MTVIKLSSVFLLLLSYTNVAGQITETKPCMLDTNPSVQAAAASPLTDDTCRASSGIQCNAGCCRFHTQILVCDTKDLFTRQPCVCNGNTDNTPRDGTGGGGPDIPLPPSTPAPAAAPVTAAPINSNAQGRAPGVEVTCAEPTVW